MILFLRGFLGFFIIVSSDNVLVDNTDINNNVVNKFAIKHVSFIN